MIQYKILTSQALNERYDPGLHFGGWYSKGNNVLVI